jgi:hypothetical protein
MGELKTPLCSTTSTPADDVVEGRCFGAVNPSRNQRMKASTAADDVEQLVRRETGKE